jgi:hypothetical protein
MALPGLSSAIVLGAYFLLCSFATHAAIVLQDSTGQIRTGFLRTDDTVQALLTFASPPADLPRLKWYAPPSSANPDGAEYFEYANKYGNLGSFFTRCSPDFAGNTVCASVLEIDGRIPSFLLGEWKVVLYFEAEDGTLSAPQMEQKFWINSGIAEGPGARYGYHNSGFSHEIAGTEYYDEFFTEGDKIAYNAELDYYYHPLKAITEWYHWEYVPYAYVSGLQIKFLYLWERVKRKNSGEAVSEDLHTESNDYITLWVYTAGWSWPNTIKSPNTIETPDMSAYDLHYFPGQWEVELHLDSGDGQGYVLADTKGFKLTDNTRPKVKIIPPENNPVKDSKLRLTGTVTDNADKVRQKGAPHLSEGNGGGSWHVVYYTADGSVKGEQSGLLSRVGVINSGVMEDFDSQGNYVAGRWYVDALPLKAGRNAITITAKDKAGEEGKQEIEVNFANGPPKLQLAGFEAVMEEFDYPLWMKATDENRNLKQIKAQWGDGSEAYTHDVPLDSLALQAQSEDTATHVYSRRSLSEPYSDYEITATATDEEDAQSEELRLPVRVLSLEALENDPCNGLVSLRSVGDPIDTSSGAQILDTACST